MPDLTETTQSLRQFLNARVPLVVITTLEPGRAREAVMSVAHQFRQMPFYEHSRTEGVKDVRTGQTVDEDTSLVAALEFARRAFKSRENVNVLFTDVEDIEDESSTSRHLREMIRLAESRAGTLVIVTEKPVWAGLRRLGMGVVLDVPTQQELADSLGELISAQHGGGVDIHWVEDDIQHAAEILKGVTMLEAENVLASLMASGHLYREDLEKLSSFKDQIVGEMSGVERIRLAEDYRVGGLHNLKRWLEKRRTLMDNDLRNRRLPPPKGVLLVGVPGCGKSLSAKAIAVEWRLPLYRLDMAGILGMYVGQSESRLREALAGAERVAPCVLWVDEIEKALTSGGGDSGVSRRLIGQFLYWMQEQRSKVFLVATANDIRSLPPELLRKGRFDEIFFVDLPDAEAREEILRLYFQRYLDHDVSPLLLETLVSASDGFSGAEIDATVCEIAMTMEADGIRQLPADYVVADFFANVVPLSRTNVEEIDALRTWGATRCVPAGAKLEHDARTAAAASPRRILTL